MGGAESAFDGDGASGAEGAEGTEGAEGAGGAEGAEGGSMTIASLLLLPPSSSRLMGSALAPPEA